MARFGPRMKTAAPLLRGSGLLHIVGRRSVHSIADPDGAIHRLVELADGSRDLDALLGALRAEFPGIDAAAVAAAVRELEEAGVFETSPPGPRRFGGAGRRELAALYA
jgi:hypothetical protein